MKYTWELFPMYLRFKVYSKLKTHLLNYPKRICGFFFCQFHSQKSVKLFFSYSFFESQICPYTKYKQQQILFTLRVEVQIMLDAIYTYNCSHSICISVCKQPLHVVMTKKKSRKCFFFFPRLSVQLFFSSFFT